MRLLDRGMPAVLYVRGRACALRHARRPAAAAGPRACPPVFSSCGQSFPDAWKEGEKKKIIHIQAIRAIDMNELFGASCLCL